MKRLIHGDKGPSMKQLRSEKEKLTKRKNQEYEDYSFARAKLRELQTIQSNVNAIFKDPQLHSKEEHHEII